MHSQTNVILIPYTLYLKKTRAARFTPDGSPHEKHEHKNYNKERIRSQLVLWFLGNYSKMTKFNIP